MRQSQTSPMRGTPWAPKALFGSGRQAPSQKPTPSHPYLKTSKKWVSSGGRLGGGGSGPKTHWGMHLLNKLRILQGVKVTIQPLGVGYANGPKKAQMGGMWHLPLYTPAWL